MVALVIMTHTNTEAIEIIAIDRDSSGIIRIAIEFSSARNCLVGAMERGRTWDWTDIGRQRSACGVAVANAAWHD